MMSTDTQYIGRSPVVAGAKAHRGLKLGSDHEKPNSELDTAGALDCGWWDCCCGGDVAKRWRIPFALPDYSCQFQYLNLRLSANIGYISH